MNTQSIAEAFPVGEHLADELEARGWTQADFAKILGRPEQFVSEIINGKKEVTRESASQIAAALGTSAEFWLNLQDSYLLWKQAKDPILKATLDEVRLRARLHELAPMSLLRNRGFITASDLESQAQQLMNLLGLATLDDEVAITFASRRSNADENTTTLQQSWVACVRARAKHLVTQPYSPEEFEALAKNLVSLARDAEGLRPFQNYFASTGVKLVYVEAFPGSKLDGCAFMQDDSPVVGISGRGKRLDKVLFTILHEVAHILLGHLPFNGEVIVDDLTKEPHALEIEADQLAAKLAIPGPVPTLPNKVTMRWVAAQADQLGIPPVVLIGRLQNNGEISWQSTLARNAPQAIQDLKQWA